MAAAPPAAATTTTPPPPFPRTVAIIGASLTGLSLALSLLQSSLFPPSAITIYDVRPAPTSASASSSTDPTNPPSPTPAPTPGFNPATTASGVILTPNGLAVLAHLGVLPRIAPRCWTSAHRTFRADGDGDKLLRKTRIAGEEAGYGFANHRCWRAVLVGEMLAMAVAAGVEVRWGARFEGVVGDDGGGDEDESDGGGGDGVRFVVSTADAREQCAASILVGADGIYSTVRKLLAPTAAPEYTGTTGVLAHIAWTDVAWPRVAEGSGDYDRQCTLQGAAGALFWIPEDDRGSVVMVGKQVRMDGEGRGREAWEALAMDKDYLCGFYRDGYEQWGATGRKVIDAVCRNKDTLYLWPFMRMARLERWFSPSGRVLIMGDAAHALPPSSGQGLNQALEDAYVLTKVLGLVKEGKKDMHEALRFWQHERQKRIDQVFDWATNATNVQRLPQAEREKLVKSGMVKTEQEVDDMRWLYKPDWDEVIEKWASS